MYSISEMVEPKQCDDRSHATAERDGAGNPHAAAQLLPLVYNEFRRLAAARLAVAQGTVDVTGIRRREYHRLRWRNICTVWAVRAGLACLSTSTRSPFVQVRKGTAPPRGRHNLVARAVVDWDAVQGSRAPTGMRVGPGVAEAAGARANDFHKQCSIVRVALYGLHNAANVTRSASSRTSIAAIVMVGPPQVASGVVRVNVAMDAKIVRAAHVAPLHAMDWLVGNVSSLVVLQHYMERELAELLSNPRIAAALRLWIRQLKE